MLGGICKDSLAWHPGQRLASNAFQMLNREIAWSQNGQFADVLKRYSGTDVFSMAAA